MCYIMKNVLVVIIARAVLSTGVFCCALKRQQMLSRTFDDCRFFVTNRQSCHQTTPTTGAVASKWWQKINCQRFLTAVVGSSVHSRKCKSAGNCWIEFSAVLGLKRHCSSNPIYLEIFWASSDDAFGGGRNFSCKWLIQLKNQHRCRMSRRKRRNASSTQTWQLKTQTTRSDMSTLLLLI